MRRAFPILATVVALLLAAGFSLDLIGRGGDLARRVRLVSATSAIAVHSATLAYLLATGRWVEREAARSGLPGWVGAQAEKNLRKGLVYQVSGSLMAVAGAGLPTVEWWSPFVSGSSVSFQFGSFIGEGLIVAGQSRLLRDVGTRVALGRSACDA